MSTISEQTQTVDIPPQVVLITMLRSFWASQAIAVAAELKVADSLKEGAKACREIAEETGTNERALYRMLRALASVGVFREVEPAAFENTDLSACLISDVPFNLREGAMSIGKPYQWMSFGNLLATLKTGETAFDNLYGMSVFDYLAQHEDLNHNFNQVMNSLSEVTIPSVIAGYDFSQFDTIVDVGGGYGSMSLPILQANPGLKGIVFDQPHVVDKTVKYIEDAGLSERAQAVPGSFFEAIPTGGDAYLMKYIIHDWDDEKAVAILKQVRAAIGDTGAKLILMEHVIPEKNQPSDAQFLDMTMLVMFGGAERTEAEYRALLGQADFSLDRVIPTPSGIFLIECSAR